MYKEQIDILTEISLPLIDIGLDVHISDKPSEKTANYFKSKGIFFVQITDTMKVVCKKYPEDDMDWLYGKEIINEFLEDLDLLGVERDVDYRAYAGGLSVNFIFSKEGIKKVKL